MRGRGGLNSGLIPGARTGNRRYMRAVGRRDVGCCERGSIAHGQGTLGAFGSVGWYTISIWYSLGVI